MMNKEKRVEIRLKKITKYDFPVRLSLSLDYDHLNRPILYCYISDVDECNESYKDNEIVQKFKVWSNYSWNDMHEGTKRQRAAMEILRPKCKEAKEMLMKAGMKKGYLFDSFDWYTIQMRMLGLEYDDGIRFTERVYEKVPENILSEINDFFEREDIKAYMEYERWHHKHTKLFNNWKKEWLENKGDNND